jgi:hypothetical protein
VASATVDDLQSYASAVAPGRHDDFSRQALARSLAEYAPRRRERVAAFTLTVDGHEYPSVLAALSDRSATFESLDLALVDPPPEGREWEWMLPFQRIEFEADGSAELFPLGAGGKSRRAIGRVLLREHYVPRGRADVEHASAGASTDELAMQLDPVRKAVEFARKHGVLPFAIALLLYLSDERVRYELDLLDGVLLRDPRAGRLPIARRVHRSSQVSHAVDEYLAHGELPISSARALELLVETHGLSALELSHIVGGVREFGGSALQGLTARGLATYDKRTAVYRPRFDAFLAGGGLRSASELNIAPLPNPALRTSVMELLAAADSRATCPLCGDALPPGPRTILCARCQAEVGDAA